MCPDPLHVLWPGPSQGQARAKPSQHGLSKHAYIQSGGSLPSRLHTMANRHTDAQGNAGGDRLRQARRMRAHARARWRRRRHRHRHRLRLCACWHRHRLHAACSAALLLCSPCSCTHSCSCSYASRARVVQARTGCSGRLHVRAPRPSSPPWFFYIFLCKILCNILWIRSHFLSCCSMSTRSFARSASRTVDHGLGTCGLARVRARAVRARSRGASAVAALGAAGAWRIFGLHTFFNTFPIRCRWQPARPSE